MSPQHISDELPRAERPVPGLLADPAATHGGGHSHARMQGGHSCWTPVVTSALDPSCGPCTGSIPGGTHPGLRASQLRVTRDVRPDSTAARTEPVTRSYWKPEEEKPGRSHKTFPHVGPATLNEVEIFILD